MILCGLRENHKAYGFLRNAVRAGIYQKGITGREAPLTVCHLIGVYVAAGIIGIVEIESPVKDSLDSIFIYLKAVNPVSG